MFNKTFALVLAGSLLVPSVYAAESEYPGASFARPATPAVNKDDAALAPIFGTHDANGSIDYYAFDLSDHTRSSAGVRSLLVPGWGQAFNGEKGKGILLFGMTAAVGVAALASYNDAHQTYDEYKSSGRRDSSKYDDYTKKQNLSFVLAGLTGLLWGISIVDAMQNSALPLHAQAQTTVVLNDRGIPEVVYSRRF